MSNHVDGRPIHPDGYVHGAIVGCRRGDGRWLLIRRGLTIRAAPGKICFPGGAVELDESPQASAAREFEEELGVAVRIVSAVWDETFEGKRNLKLWGFLGEIESHDFAPCETEVEDVLWMTVAEASGHPDVLPKTDDFLRALERAWLEVQSRREVIRDKDGKKERAD